MDMSKVAQLTFLIITSEESECQTGSRFSFKTVSIKTTRNVAVYEC